MRIQIHKAIQRRPHWLTVPVAATAGVVLLLGASGGAAYALTSATAPKPGNYTLYGCVAGSTRTLTGVYTVAANFKGCPKGSFAVAWNSTGPRGPAGPPGPKGDSGPQGPSGPPAISQVGSVGQAGSGKQLQYIGGTILQNSPGTGATNVLRVHLSGGTYLINAHVTFDRSVTAGTGAPDTYGYLALWTGTASNSAFTNSNQAAGTFTTGPLPRLVAGSDVIDATASGSHVMFVPDSGIYLNLSVFARNADGSSGPYPGCTVDETCSSNDLGQAGSVVARAAGLEIVKMPAVQPVVFLP